jgi:hypothetical protein
VVPKIAEICHAYGEPKTKQFSLHLLHNFLEDEVKFTKSAGIHYSSVFFFFFFTQWDPFLQKISTSSSDELPEDRSTQPHYQAPHYDVLFQTQALA